MKNEEDGIFQSSLDANLIRRNRIIDNARYGIPDFAPSMIVDNHFDGNGTGTGADDIYGTWAGQAPGSENYCTGNWSC